jgi:hypothetical protein
MLFAIPIQLLSFLITFSILLYIIYIQFVKTLFFCYVLFRKQILKIVINSIILYNYICGKEKIEEKYFTNKLDKLFKEKAENYLKNDKWSILRVEYRYYYKGKFDGVLCTFFKKGEKVEIDLGFIPYNESVIDRLISGGYDKNYEVLPFIGELNTRYRGRTYRILTEEEMKKLSSFTFINKEEVLKMWKEAEDATNGYF